jgi:hypothetical protein
LACELAIENIIKKANPPRSLNLRMTSLLQRQLLLNFKTTNKNCSYNLALAACVTWLSSVERRVVAQLTRPGRLRRSDQTYHMMSM